MDSCPFELWSKIAGYACTDGGYTGRSLSLVSRRMQSAVEPVRYYSICLKSNQKLFAFASRLMALDKPSTIRHLFIAGLHVHSPRIDEAGSFEGWQKSRARLQEDIGKINDAIRNIVTSCASTICTLTIHDWDPRLDVEHITFPHLHSATLLTVPRQKSAEDTHRRFPSLRRLHLLTTYHTHHFWQGISAFAPRITNLRLSNVSVDSYIAPYLRILLEVPPPPKIPGIVVVGSSDSFPPGTADAQEALAVASRLACLEHIDVRPFKYDSTGDRCGNNGMAHGGMMWDLQAIASASAKRQGSRKFTLQPEQPRYSLEEALEEWLETVDGRDGQWFRRSIGRDGPADIPVMWYEAGLASEKEESPTQFVPAA